MRGIYYLSSLLSRTCLVLVEDVEEVRNAELLGPVFAPLDQHALQGLALPTGELLPAADHTRQEYQDPECEWRGQDGAGGVPMLPPYCLERG